MEIKRIALRGLARYGNIIYEVASALRSESVRKMAQRRPALFVPSPEQVAAQTAFRISPTLQHVIREISGRELSLPEAQKLIAEGQEAGLFINHGQAIFINQHRVDDLLILLGLAPETKDSFMSEAKKHYLLRDFVYAAQATGHFSSTFRPLSRGNYVERDYHLLTRDGRPLTMTRVLNIDRVKTNDDRPSVLLVPGIACNGRFFDLDDSSSLALEQADQGRWVYLFDPRGLGKNKGDFDPHCFLDTLISNDLPTATDFIHNRPSPKKPVVIVGHSMGGMISLFMLVRQAHKLNLFAAQIAKMIGDPTFRLKGLSRDEIDGRLHSVEATLTGRRKADQEIRALIAEARACLDILKTVKGIITLGSPKIFDKNEHPIFPELLMLNILLPLVGEETVPVDKGKWLVKILPSLTFVLRQLIESDNFNDPNMFLHQVVAKGTDSFPLGVGLQLLKSIYSGRGVRRMEQGRFNYSANLDAIPPDIPIFDLVGTADPLAPPFNLGFIDRHFAGSRPIPSDYGEYAHARKQVLTIRPGEDPARLPLGQEKSQVTGIVIEGVGHLDFFYGKTGEQLVRPLLNRLIDLIWQL